MTLLDEVSSEKKVGSHKMTIYPIFNMDIPKEIQEDSHKRYCGGTDDMTGDPRRGLSIDEQRRFLPSRVNTNADSQNWESAVAEFWANFTEIIAYGGKEMETGVKEDGSPINFNDYCLANLAMADPSVHQTIDVTERPLGAEYILVDNTKQEEAKKEASKGQVQAIEEYAKLISSEKAATKIGYILCANARKLDLNIPAIQHMEMDELKSELLKFVTTMPTQFIADAQNEKIEFKAVIYTAVDCGLMIKQYGTDEYFWKKRNGDEEPLGKLGAAINKLKQNSSLYQEVIGNIQKAKQVV